MYRQLDQMGFQVSPNPNPNPNNPNPNPSPSPDPDPNPNPNQSGEEFVIAAREADALGATLLLG